MPRDPHITKICLIAGEASGDILGEHLMNALKQQAQGNVQFIGVGGPRMESEGLHSLFPMRDLSVMGIFEVLPRLNKIIKRIKQTSDFIREETPDLVITIDSPDFSFRVAKQVQKEGSGTPKMVHYVAPTVWAWRPERAKKVAALYDGIMCLYPFEPPYFEKEGLSASFVGHSVLESGHDKVDGKTLRTELGIPAEAKVLGVLFGSRMGELNRVGPVLRDVAEKLVHENQELHIVSPTFPHLEKQVRNLLESLNCKIHVVTEPHRKWDCFAAMDSALATSGTVGLELAVADVPHVIAYKANALTAQIIKRKVTVQYAHLVNILLDQPAVPEFIQEECKPEKIAQAMNMLDQTSQKSAFSKVREQLTGLTKEVPSIQAAKFIWNQIKVGA